MVASVRVYLGLGTNIGERGQNLREALRRLAAVMKVEKLSSVYRSDPVGYREQPYFWNMVVCGTSELPPRQLMRELIEIEADMGRIRSFPNAPRVIDIDILLYGDDVVSEPHLQIPHARMHERAFVLRPLLELAPDVCDPRTGEAFAQTLRTGTFEPADPISDLNL